MDYKPDPECIAISRSGDTTTLTLSRPAKLNALNAATVEELLAAIDSCRHDGTRLLVLRGAGKGFSGGFDFTGLEDQTDGDLALRFLRLESLLQAVHHAPFMTMALVHGPCFGAAADLVASCVYRVAAPGARFRMPGLRFGVVLGTRRLREVIGRDAARQVLAQSKIIDVEEALRIGFLTGVAGEDDWPALVEEAAGAAGVLSASRLDRLLQLTTDDNRDADLAELARSVMEPGLKARISAYLASLKAP
jgi:enoyl-CoA hydratase/carnithine racemase